MVEAHPSPAVGPEREQLVATSHAAIAHAQAAMSTALEGYLTRLNGVVIARVKGPRARKGTRWWGDSAKSLFAPAPGPGELETKALDPTYALPASLVAEAADAVRPVALRVAYDTAAHTAASLGVTVPDATDDGMFAIDHTALNQAVEDAVSRIMGVAQHHAEMIREAITGADHSADTLDEVLDQVEAAHRKGGNWVRMAGNSLTNGLIQDAAITQARALGSTHAQWLSRRDDRVRPTHVLADGQVRPIAEKFTVGGFSMAYPCDPTDLPASWPEVAGCRCSLLFRKLAPEQAAALGVLGATIPGQLGPGVGSLLKTLAGGGAAVRTVPTPPGVPVGTGGIVPQARQVVTTAPLVAYRLMDAALDTVAGQWIVLAGPIVLGLVAPMIFAEGAPVLSVLIPSGATVTVAGGALVLPQGQPLEVVANGPAGVQAQPAQLG